MTKPSTATPDSAHVIDTSLHLTSSQVSSVTGENENLVLLQTKVDEASAALETVGQQLANAKREFYDAQAVVLSVKLKRFCLLGRRRELLRAKLTVIQKTKDCDIANRLYDAAKEKLRVASNVLTSYMSHVSSREDSKKIAEALSCTSPSATDPWKSTLKAPPRPEGLRRKAATHSGYCEETGDATLAKCCLTGTIGCRKRVSTAHLLNRNAPGHHLSELEMEKSDIDNVRNMIMLCTNVEKGYDKERLCFLVDAHNPGRFILKIWDKKIKDKVLYNTEGKGETVETIGSFEGKAMVFAADKMPFHRVLSFLAQRSYEHAINQNWIDSNEPRPERYDSPLKSGELSFA